MSVHQDKKTKRWYIKVDNITYRKDDQGNNFLTKKAAKNYESLLLARIGNKETNILLFEFISIYLDWKKPYVKKSTLVSIDAALKILVDNISNKKLYAYKPIDFLKYERFLANSSYSTSHKNKILSTAKTMFKHAIDYYGLSRNPLVQIKPFKPTQEELIKGYEKDFHVWGIEQFDAFYNAIMKDAVDCRVKKDYQNEYQLRRVAMFFLLAFDLGTRMSETNTIQVKDYDIELQVIHIRNQVESKDGNKLVALKTKSSIRDIDVSNYTHKKILEQIDYLKTLSGYNDDYYICGGLDSVPQTTLTRIKDKYIKDYQIMPRINIHEFRHTHATMLIDAGVPLEIVSRRLGHSSISITEKIYVHYLEKKNEILIININNIHKH